MKLKKAEAALSKLREEIASVVGQCEQCEAACRAAADDESTYAAAVDRENDLRGKLDALRRRETHLSAQVQELRAADLDSRIDAARKAVEVAKANREAVGARTLKLDRDEDAALRAAKLKRHNERNAVASAVRNAEAALETLLSKRSPKPKPVHAPAIEPPATVVVEGAPRTTMSDAFGPNYHPKLPGDEDIGADDRAVETYGNKPARA